MNERTVLLDGRRVDACPVLAVAVRERMSGSRCRCCVMAACLNVEDLEAVWLEEEDDHLNPLGSKGTGEVGIVDTAVVNAVWHATGVRVRKLPVQPDSLLADLPPQWPGR